MSNWDAVDVSAGVYSSRHKPVATEQSLALVKVTGASE